MAKREHWINRQKSSSKKTAKRLEMKRVMLEARKVKKGAPNKQRKSK